MCQSESNEARLAAINGYVKERVAEREKELDDIVAKLEKDFKKGKNFSSTEWNDQFWFIRWKIRYDIRGVKMRCDNLNNSNNGFKPICDMDEIVKPFTQLRSKICKTKTTYGKKFAVLQSY